jgi:hypothetical protein
MAPAATGSWFTFAGDLEGALVRGALVKAVERDCTTQAEMSLMLLEAMAAPHGTGAPTTTGSARPVLRLVHSAAPAD